MTQILLCIYRISVNYFIEKIKNIYEPFDNTQNYINELFFFKL